MTLDLSDRVALVTGSSTGIGRAIGERLAARGSKVVIHGVDPEENSLLAREWRSKGWRCHPSSVDLAQPGAALSLYEEVSAELGKPDILVLNASIERPETLAVLSQAAMEEQFAVNVSSNLLLLQACIPNMLFRGWGRVVAMGSVQEEKPNARHLFYAATKAALTSTVLNLARNERSGGVTFNIIRPGAIRTGRNRDALADPVFEQQVVERVPLGKIGAPADLVGAISLLCSDEGSYINGAVIAVDGGMRL
jgi:NAD(P)-dependent dehydrogenase (short-subunit alcohol dehydrogenase family)